MKEKTIIILIAFFYLTLLLTTSVCAELQDMVDSQGNKYEIDKDGTMYTYGDPNVIRQPASIENLPYYYNETMNLIAKKYKFEGIIMGSEILDLPEKSVGIRVSKWSIGKVLAPVISESELNQKVVVVKHIEDNSIIYRNRLYDFELKYPLFFKPFAELAGLEEDTMANVGFVLTDPSKKELPINVIMFAKHLKANTSLDEFASQWSLVSKYPDIKFIPISSPFGTDSKGIDVEWLEGGKVPFAGEQIFVIKDGVGYYIMLSSPKDKYDESYKTFKEFLSNIKFAKMPPLKYIPDDDPEVKAFLKKKTSNKKN
jgi:hypothetical protein